MPDSLSIDSLIELYKERLSLLERTGNAEPLVQLCSEEIELSHPSIRYRMYGKAGAYRYWRSSAFLFQHVETRFYRVIRDPGPGQEGQEQIALEWTQIGILPQGTIVQLEGTTHLAVHHGKITRLRTYFDRAALEQSEESATRSQQAA